MGKRKDKAARYPSGRPPISNYRKKHPTGLVMGPRHAWDSIPEPASVEIESPPEVPVVEVDEKKPRNTPRGNRPGESVRARNLGLLTPQKDAVGIVVRYHSGFGFLEVAGKRPHVFVHWSTVKDAGRQELIEGEKLVFDIEPSTKKEGALVATNLRFPNK